MARMLETVITIKASKLVPDVTNEEGDVLSQEVIDSISEIVKELAGVGVLVEVYPDLGDAT